MPSQCSRKKKKTCKKPCTWRKGTYNKQTRKRVRKGSCAKPSTRRRKTVKRTPRAAPSRCAAKRYKSQCSKPCTWRKRSTKNGRVVRRGSCAKPRKSASGMSMIQQLMARSSKRKSACNEKKLKAACDADPTCQWRKGSRKNGKYRKGYCARNPRAATPCAAMRTPMQMLNARVPLPPQAPLPALTWNMR